MEITEQVIKDINKCVNEIAEDYQQETHYDDDGHAFEMRWSDCIMHAIDDFIDDTKGYMDCFGYELSDDEAEELGDYAWNFVNLDSIRKYA